MAQHLEAQRGEMRQRQARAVVQAPAGLPPVRGDADFAWHVAHSLVDDEFDITLCQDMPLDHGALTPISALWPDHSAGWPCAVLPLAVNVLLSIMV